MRETPRFRTSSDCVLDERMQAVRVEVGDPAAPLVVTVPTGSPLCKRRGLTIRFGSTLSTGVKLRLRLVKPLGAKAGSIRVQAKGGDFPSRPANPLLVRVVFGNDLGEESRTWHENTPAKLFRLPERGARRTNLERCRLQAAGCRRASELLNQHPRP